MTKAWRRGVRPIALSWCFLVALWTAPAGLLAQTEPALEVLGEAPGKGEQCLVCRQPVHDDTMLEVRYRGRVFHVKAEMWNELAANPESYFRALQSRSALFDEDAFTGSIGADERQRGWLYLGLYVLAGLVAGAACGALAVARGHRPLPWFALGLMANAAALAVLVTRPRGTSRGPEGIPAGLAKVPTTRAPRACPHCGRPNHPAARSCSDCGSALTPVVDAETARLVGGDG